MNNVILDS